MAAEDEPRSAGTDIKPGEDLSALSVDEITHRIERLRAEIIRLERARDEKSTHLAAAASLFGPR
jgi:uncharacterized small protein (DUF1192 family)